VARCTHKQAFKEKPQFARPLTHYEKNACFSIRLERKLEDLLVGRPPRRFADYVQSEDRQQRRSITRKEYCAYNLHETSSAIPRLQMTALRDRQIAIAQ
jgi:hypothetical protein